MPHPDSDVVERIVVVENVLEGTPQTVRRLRVVRQLDD